MPFTRAALVGDVPPGGSKQVILNGVTLALFNIDGAIHAINGTCPHRGAPLWEGALTGQELECPWHAAKFNVTTGAHLCPPARDDVAVYPVRIVGEEIQIDV
jgi:nitrite reductase/ring-hydroxylating ferredoxin subunit